MRYINLRFTYLLTYAPKTEYLVRILVQHSHKNWYEDRELLLTKFNGRIPVSSHIYSESLKTVAAATLM